MKQYWSEGELVECWTLTGVERQLSDQRTGCEFSVAQKLLAWATVEGNRCIREQYGQKNACDSVAERGRECA
jgi:hypothetical protein